MLDHPGPVTVSPQAFGKRSRFTFMAVDSRSLFDVLEACLVADVLVPVVDAKEGVSPDGVKLASVIKAQGLMAGMEKKEDKKCKCFCSSFAGDHWNAERGCKFASCYQEGIASRSFLLVSQCVSRSTS